MLVEIASEKVQSGARYQTGCLVSFASVSVALFLSFGLVQSNLHVDPSEPRLIGSRNTRFGCMEVTEFSKWWLPGFAET